MIIKLIQQESGSSNGVRLHAAHEEEGKTLCGVKFTERPRWFDYGDRYHVTDVNNVDCGRCRNKIDKLLGEYYAECNSH